MSRLARDQEASAGVITFLVAGVIFVASIGAVLVLTHGSGGGVAASDAAAANLQGQAKSLSSFLLDSPGYDSSTHDWIAGANAAASTPNADHLLRLGLKDATSSDPTMLNFTKFQNLRRAPYAAANDGYVNYEEARAELGLATAGLDFHIRAYPSLQNVTQIIQHGYRDANLRVTYLGHVGVSKPRGSSPPPANPTEGLTVGTPVCAVSPLPGAYRLSVLVTNGGNTTTQFNALVEYELGSSGGLSQNTNGFPVAPGGSATLFVDVPAVSGTSCATGSDLHFHVHDPSTSTVEVETHLSTAVTGASAAATDLLLDTTKPYFQNPTGATSGCSDHAKFTYDGKSLPKSAGHTDYYVDLKVTSTDGATTYYTASQSIPASSNQRTFDAGCLVAGSYLATLYYCGTSTCTGSATTEQVTENVLVTTGSLPAYTPPSQPASGGSNVYTPATGVAQEVGFLNTLVKSFCPTYFDNATASPIAGQDWSTPTDGAVGADDTWAQRCASFASAPADVRASQPGDVFPDSKDVMNNDLPLRLADASGNPRYDVTNVLVVGSNVDQTAMSSQAAKGTVGDWVLGGGTLIVFGSAAQNVNWLEPIFHAAIRSSSGGLGTPDPGNAVLHSADELDYPHYSNNNRVWSFTGQTAQDAAQLFNNVVVQGTDPITTLSNPGAFGDGRVILTTWMPYDTYSGARDPATTQLEGLKLVHNFLVQGYQSLFLDYGPALPPHTNVVPAVRYAEVNDPDFAEPVQLSIVVFVFK